MAQTPSPSWTITQNAGFPLPSAGTRFLDAVSANDVWAVGYDGTAPSLDYNWYSKTNNGGTSWSGGNIFADTNTYVIANLEGVDANTAWVSAYMKASQSQGAIYKTTNGGTTWTNMTAAGMFTNSASFTDIVCFLTPSVGITMGDPNGVGNEFEIWRTNDAGATWTVVPGANIPNPLSGEYGLVNVYTKQGTTNIWYGTNKGRIYRSTDAGLTWNVSTLTSTMSSSTADVNDIAFVDAMNGVAYVYNTQTSPATFQMFNTTDGGATWNVISNMSPNVGKNDIAVVPGTNIFVSAGAGTGNTILAYSSDLGVTWTDWGSSGIQYLNIDFFDANNGWAGSFSDPSNPAIGGIFKYNGPTIVTAVQASFNSPSITCPFTTITTTNTSISANSYTWSVAPSASASVSAPNATNTSVTFNNGGTFTVTLVASNGSSTATYNKIITVTGCTGIESNAVSSNLVVYPNPVKDILTIEVAGTDTYAVTVTNLLGKTVIAERDKSTLNVSNLTPGVYFLTIDVKGQKTTKKIVVE